MLWQCDPRYYGSGGGCCGSVALVTMAVVEGMVSSTAGYWQWWKILIAVLRVLAVVEGLVSSSKGCWQWRRLCLAVRGSVFSAGGCWRWRVLAVVESVGIVEWC